MKEVYKFQLVEQFKTILIGALILNIIFQVVKYNTLESDKDFLISEMTNASQRAAENQLIINQQQELIDIIINQPYDIFQVASETYDIPVELLMSIEVLESGHYTSDLFLNNNNTWGCRRDGEWATFDSPEQSTMELARTLRYSYFDNGLNTPELIAPVFCPPTPEEWAESINNLMGG